MGKALGVIVSLLVVVSAAAASVCALEEGASQTQQTHLADDFGASPFDDQPDSDAIQACVDQLMSGDTVLFTSDDGSDDYRGYLIDKTIFLVRNSPRSDLTFTSTDTESHALLKATADLRGFVVRLWARSSMDGILAGQIDDIRLTHVDLDGNRQERVAIGYDGIDGTADDNWGSWLNECPRGTGAWCSPGTLAMDGMIDTEDLEEDYEGNPDRWSTGLVVHDVVIANTEGGSACVVGGAACTVDSVTIRDAGDHVHARGCAQTDPDEPIDRWSDGMSVIGPALRITNNTVINASDIGITAFGGRDTVIEGNTVIAEEGNHGMFGGIVVGQPHVGTFAGIRVANNTVVNEASVVCGGIHVGIHIGGHLWGGGCVGSAEPAAFGAPGCPEDLPAGGVVDCPDLGPCRLWGYIPAGESFELVENRVVGAQVNYLVEGIYIEGQFVAADNLSETPRMTDWENDVSCGCFDTVSRVRIHHYVAHDPVLLDTPTVNYADGQPITSWEDICIHCER